MPEPRIRTREAMLLNAIASGTDVSMIHPRTRKQILLKNLALQKKDPVLVEQVTQLQPKTVEEVILKSIDGLSSGGGDSTDPEESGSITAYGNLFVGTTKGTTKIKRLVPKQLNGSNILTIRSSNGVPEDHPNYQYVDTEVTFPAVLAGEGDKANIYANGEVLEAYEAYTSFVAPSKYIPHTTAIKSDTEWMSTVVGHLAYIGYIGTLRVFNMKTASFDPNDPITSPYPLNETMFFHSDGWMYFISSKDEADALKLIRVNLTTKEVERLPDLPEPRPGAGGIKIGDKIYIGPGYATTLLILDLKTGTWSQSCTVPSQTRSYMYHENGYIYFTRGGYVYKSNPSPRPTCRYSIADNTYSVFDVYASWGFINPVHEGGRYLIYTNGNVEVGIQDIVTGTRRTLSTNYRYFTRDIIGAMVMYETKLYNIDAGDYTLATMTGMSSITPVTHQFEIPEIPTYEGATRIEVIGMESTIEI